MKLLLLFVGVCLVVTATAKHCQSTMDCTHRCSDGYHEQCINTQCTCPDHTCSAATDCPQGSGSGCPPSCTTTCDNSKCSCNCNDSN